MPHTIWTVTAYLLMTFISDRKSTVHNGGVEIEALWVPLTSRLDIRKPPSNY